MQSSKALHAKLSSSQMDVDEGKKEEEVCLTLLPTRNIESSTTLLLLL